MKNIVLLDDDPLIHQFISKIVLSLSYNFFSVLNVDEALNIIKGNNIDLVICDLFLEGDFGDKLSNDFIRQELVPRNIPYCRLTSAPGLVPSDCEGIVVLNKEKFHDDEMKLYEVLTHLK